MSKQLWNILFLMVLTLSTAFDSTANASIVTSFDSDTEGWRVVTLNLNNTPPTAANSRDPQFVPTGGNPGGYIKGQEFAGASDWFSAPAEYLGSHADKLDGTLSFSLLASTNPTNYPTAVGVAIVGDNDTTIFRDIASPLTSVWTEYELLLAASGDWHFDTGADATDSEIESILSEIQGIYIRSDWSNGLDSTGLDSVSLASPVPLPSALLLFASSFTALVGFGFAKTKCHCGRDGEAACS